MTQIRWTHAAAEDLEHIKDYLTEYSPQLAQSTILELYETIRSLRHHPAADGQDAKRGRENWYYRLPYIVAYRIKEQAVEVLHIFHGAQNRP